LREAETREATRRVNMVLDELRRRLGSTFTVEELADTYGEGTSWADAASGMESWIVDAAFHRYLREAKNYAGGRAPVE
jgi:DNA-directed RNA polymerase specialized sigma subunit